MLKQKQEESKASEEPVNKTQDDANKDDEGNTSSVIITK